MLVGHLCHDEFRWFFPCPVRTLKWAAIASWPISFISVFNDSSKYFMLAFKTVSLNRLQIHWQGNHNIEMAAFIRAFIVATELNKVSEIMAVAVRRLGLLSTSLLDDVLYEVWKALRCLVLLNIIVSVWVTGLELVTPNHDRVNCVSVKFLGFGGRVTSLNWHEILPEYWSVYLTYQTSL